MSNKVWAVLFDGVCAVELYEDRAAALKRYTALAKSGEIPHLQETVVHGGEVERWQCPRCCNVGTVCGRQVNAFGLPPRELCPECIKEGRIRQLSETVWHVAEPINQDAVHRALGEWYKEPKQEIDYSLAAGGDEDG